MTPSEPTPTRRLHYSHWKLTGHVSSFLYRLGDHQLRRLGPVGAAVARRFTRCRGGATFFPTACGGT